MAERALLTATLCFTEDLPDNARPTRAGDLPAQTRQRLTGTSLLRCKNSRLRAFVFFPLFCALTIRRTLPAAFLAIREV